MGGPHPSTAAVRLAVRRALAAFEPDRLVLVAVSGGADSMALADALAHEAPARGLLAQARVIDHKLQPGSANVARDAVAWVRALGLPAQALGVTVQVGSGGVESAAREARYAALEAEADRLGATVILLGHTRDDQAEQVLLGLARGAGARSLSGMPPARGRLLRPLLQVTRAQTRAACAAEGVPFWDDPMNEDPAYLRVRARRALADLESDLGPGFAAALARSADQLRDDADHLDTLARAAFVAVTFPPTPTGSRHSEREIDARMTSNRWAEQGQGEVDATRLADLPRAVRGRVWRLILIAAGAPAGQVSTRHTDACDALLTDWHGQGPLHVPGDLRVARLGTTIRVRLAGPER